MSLSRILYLIADSDREPLFNELGTVAIKGMVRNTCHGYPPDHLATLFAGEYQLQFPSNGDAIFKEGFEKVTDSIEQEGMGILLLNLHIVTHHRCQVIGIHILAIGIADSVFRQTFWNAVVGFIVSRRGHNPHWDAQTFLPIVGLTFRSRQGNFRRVEEKRAIVDGPFGFLVLT